MVSAPSAFERTWLSIGRDPIAAWLRLSLKGQVSDALAEPAGVALAILQLSTRNFLVLPLDLGALAVAVSPPSANSTANLNSAGIERHRRCGRPQFLARTMEKPRRAQC